MRWVPAAQLPYSPLLHDPCTLGIVTFGTLTLPAASHLPRAHFVTPLIDDDDRVELWSGRTAARDETVGPVRCRHNGDVLYATVAQPAAGGDDALGEATYAAYRALLQALQATGYAHLLRIWNSIPHINVDDAGLERYRRFNLQRYKAYQESGRPTETGAPAACALGSFGGPLVLHCLASKSPAEAIENPRQTSAYQYPQQYGPRAPSFSRAALWRDENGPGDVLFVSGTASIVGHQTMHPGDVVAQTRETLANLEAIVAQAVLHRARGISRLSDLTLKAYLRHPADAPAVRKVLTEHGLDVDAVLMLHADVCRADLLVEIEGLGPRSAS